MAARRRNFIKPAIRKAMAPRTGRVVRRHRPPVVKLEEKPRPPWHVPAYATPRTARALLVVVECFPPDDVDAVLGWLFSRYPELGAQGDDMVRHHLRLRDDRYYEAWVLFCLRLELSF